MISELKLIETAIDDEHTTLYSHAELHKTTVCQILAQNRVVHAHKDNSNPVKAKISKAREGLNTRVLTAWYR